MCGIVGYFGKRNASEILVDGLRRLEYRGYDSAGIACVYDGRIEVVKNPGKIRELRKRIDESLKKCMQSVYVQTVDVDHTGPFSKFYKAAYSARSSFCVSC